MKFFNITLLTKKQMKQIEDIVIKQRNKIRELEQFIHKNQTVTIIKEDKYKIKQLEEKIKELKYDIQYYKNEAHKARHMEKLAWSKLAEFKDKLNKCTLKLNIALSDNRYLKDTLKQVHKQLLSMLNDKKDNNKSNKFEVYV